MNGVCQTKNQTIACLRSLSSFNVIILETTCGCPATPRPPRKNAATHSVAPNLSSDGNMLTMFGSMPAMVLWSPEKPPTFPNATTQRIVDPTIITQDWAASVQIEALIPPA